MGKDAATRPDPRAVKLARSLLESERAELVILFGSRARGDYEEGRSDVDLLLVNEEIPLRERQQEVLAKTEAQAEYIYERQTPVQLLWYTHEHFDRMRRSINHIAAKAYTEGIIMPGDPEDYQARYSDDYDSYENEWTVTDQRIRNAESHRANFLILFQGGGDDRGLGKNAQEGLEHALKAVISAAGVRYPRDHHIGRLTAVANRADPSLNFQSAIPADLLNQYAGSDDYYPPERRITDVPDFREKFLADLDLLLTRARAIQEERRKGE